jgi:hypothetical protein
MMRSVALDALAARRVEIGAQPPLRRAARRHLDHAVEPEPDERDAPGDDPRAERDDRLDDVVAIVSQLSAMTARAVARARDATPRVAQRASRTRSWRRRPIVLQLPAKYVHSSAMRLALSLRFAAAE